MENKTVTILFEGVDRSGKDTLIERTKEVLESNGLSVGLYRNPAFPVRELLLSKGTTLNSTESLPIFYSGYLNVQRKIKEADYDVALINRRMLSSFVYQEIGEESLINFDDVQGLFQYAPLEPVDLCILLDVAEEELLRRAEELALDEDDRYENGLDSLIKRRNAYNNLPQILMENELLGRLTTRLSKVIHNDPSDTEEIAQYISYYVATGSTTD